MEPHPVITHRFETQAQKPTFLRELFDAGAPFYDRVVGWGFLGTGKMYRRMAQQRAGLRAGMKVLDAAAGTGLMAEAAMRLGVPPVDIVCLDPSPGMLAVAAKKLGVKTIVASADSIPLDDDTFDCVTMGYALRHVASLEGALAEYLRVLKPGGRLLLLEITKPSNRFGDWCFRIWFRHMYPWLTRLFTGSREAERMMLYYWETMNTAVPPATILAKLEEVGFAHARRKVLGSVLSEFTAAKPGILSCPQVGA